MAIYQLKDLEPGRVLVEHGHWYLSSSDGYGSISHSETDMTTSGWIRICPATISIQIPMDFNPMALAVESVENEIERLKEAYHAKLQELICKKESLLALPNLAEGESDE